MDGESKSRMMNEEQIVVLKTLGIIQILTSLTELQEYLLYLYCMYKHWFEKHVSTEANFPYLFK